MNVGDLMFFKRGIDFFIGYVQIELEGFFIERFLNICAKEQIRLWRTKKVNKSKIYTNISIEDFKRIRKLVRKTKCRMKIRRKRGLPFIIRKYKNRKVFIFLFFILIFSIFALSNFIWNIEIEGNQTISEEEIMSEINKLGLYQGILKNKVNANKIIDSLRLENEKIAWIGMKIEGTNAKITIVEATEKPEIIDENEYCNIVASKEGIITKVNVTNGTAVCKPGDVVEKGDKLIEGWMEGKYTGVRYMHASGEIEARVWYTAEKTESYIQTENEKTGEEENRYSIIFNKKQINFYKTLSKFKKYDTIKIDKKIKLFNNFYLPIEFRKSTNYEYKEVERQYTSEALKEKILTELEEQIKENLTDKEIANKDVIIEEQNGAMKVRLIYEVLEKIGVEEKLVS